MISYSWNNSFGNVNRLISNFVIDNVSIVIIKTLLNYIDFNNLHESNFLHLHIYICHDEMKCLIDR